MACFDNIIALKELCTDITPTSGQYLNDIGITKSLIEDIILSDSDDVQDFVDDKIAFATRLVTEDVHQHFNKDYKVTALVSGHRLGETQDNKQVVAGTARQGLSFQLNNKGNFLKVFINEISLQVNTTGDITIEVYDLKQGKQLTTKTISAVSGEIVSINPSIEILSDKKDLDLWIGYDATGIDTIKTTLTGCGSCSGYTLKNNYITATGASIESPYIRSSLTNLSHTSGLSIVYSVECDHRSWLCSFANYISTAVLYKTGLEIIKSATPAALQRSNNTTLISDKEITEMREDFELNYRERMDRVLENVQTPYDTACFNCKELYRHMTAPI